MYHDIPAFYLKSPGRPGKTRVITLPYTTTPAELAMPCKMKENLV
jgi:hypothetical protein